LAARFRVKAVAGSTPTCKLTAIGPRGVCSLPLTRTQPVVEVAPDGRDSRCNAHEHDRRIPVNPAGRERTIEEWEALLASSGFRLESATPSASGHAVIEAVPA
jgi:hypothetical protein